MRSAESPPVSLGPVGEIASTVILEAANVGALRHCVQQGSSELQESMEYAWGQQQRSYHNMVAWLCAVWANSLGAVGWYTSLPAEFSSSHPYVL